MKPPPLVIFHSINSIMHCDDGFAAAWVAKRALPEAELHPGIYGQKPPLDKARGRDVYLVDFSYKRPEMLALMHEAASTVVLDHHKTAEAELAGLVDEFMREERHLALDGGGAALTVLFDMERSGARIAFDYWFPEQVKFAPPLLLRIEDNDLWRSPRWYDDSLFVQAALRSYPHDLAVWDDLMARPIDDLAAEGVAIRRFIEAKIAELLPDARMVEIDGHRVEAINCPKFLASEIAGTLAERGAGPFGAAYVDGAMARTWSLRSRGDFDVSEVARRLGGGGHKQAAGYEESLP